MLTTAAAGLLLRHQLLECAVCRSALSFRPQCQCARMLLLPPTLRRGLGDDVKPAARQSGVSLWNDLAACTQLLGGELFDDTNHAIT